MEWLGVLRQWRLSVDWWSRYQFLPDLHSLSRRLSCLACILLVEGRPAASPLYTRCPLSYSSFPTQMHLSVCMDSTTCVEE